MPKLSYIGTVLAFIEHNLTADLNPERIAKNHYVSQSQLYRDFYSCTGHSVKEYIRKRRISEACEKIKGSDIPLDRIAGESGCQTQQAFHKQFKSIVGMTPLEYRQGDAYFCFLPFSVGELSLAVRVAAETIPDCRTERFYDSCLAGIEDKAIAALGEPEGRVFGRNGKQIGQQFCYEIMAEKDGTGKTGTYATCTVNYHEKEISSGWNFLYNTWLPASMFEQSEEGYFEEYLFRNGKPTRLKLYLPVKKRRAARHITLSQIPRMSFIIARERGSNAERKASEKVMGFLQQHYPLLIRSARRFYLSACGDTCECGVECPEKVQLASGCGVEMLVLPAGQYAVLQDDCLGDIHAGGDKIDAWLSGRGIAHETGRPVFAVYETLNGRYDTDNIRMNLYKLLILTETDNTEAPLCCKIEP